MIHDERLVRLTLRAAVAHAKALNGSDPRADTIFFVRCVLVDMRKRRWYDSAFTISRILRALESTSSVRAALEVFGLAVADVVVKSPTDIPPASNTGVSPPSAQMALALEEHLNGRANRGGR